MCGSNLVSNTYTSPGPVRDAIKRKFERERERERMKGAGLHKREKE